MPRNTYGFHSGYTWSFHSDCSPTRTNPAGAVASGDTNVRPSSETSWKNTSVSSASSTATQLVVSVNPFAGFAPAVFAAVRLMRCLPGSRGCEPRLDLGHHARRERVPVMGAGERTTARGFGCGGEGQRERLLDLGRRCGEQQVRRARGQIEQRRGDDGQTGGQVLVDLVRIDPLHVRVAG